MARGVHYVTLTYRITKEGKKYSVICEELGTSTCGDSVDEAIKNIRDAIGVHLNSLEQLGERERFFRERGIRVYAAPRKTVTKPVSLNYGEFVTKQNVPVPV